MRLKSITGVAVLGAAVGAAQLAGDPLAGIAVLALCVVLSLTFLGNRSFRAILNRSIPARATASDDVETPDQDRLTGSRD